MPGYHRKDTPRMAIHPYVTDLRIALSTEVAVEIVTRSGLQLLTGVVDVDEHHLIVTLHNPQHMGDSKTVRKLNINDISSLTLTDIEYKFAA